MSGFAIVGKQRLDQELAQHPDLKHLQTKVDGPTTIALLLDQSDLENVLDFLKGLRDG